MSEQLQRAWAAAYPYEQDAQASALLGDMATAKLQHEAAHRAYKAEYMRWHQEQDEKHWLYRLRHSLANWIAP